MIVYNLIPHLNMSSSYLFRVIIICLHLELNYLNLVEYTYLNHAWHKHLVSLSLKVLNHAKKIRKFLLKLIRPILIYYKNTSDL